jgi:transposase InsO family protein
MALVPPLVEALDRDLEEVGELRWRRHSAVSSDQFTVSRLGLTLVRSGRIVLRSSGLQERLRGVQKGGRSLPSRKASHSRTSPIDPSIPSRRRSSRSSLASRTRPSGFPLEVLTERRSERIPTMKVRREPITDTKAAITAAEIASVMPISGSQGRRCGPFGLYQVEARWPRMGGRDDGRAWQVELLNRRRWKTRVELANAIFEYLEIFHNRKRRHSALGMRTPIEFEKMHTYPSEVA